MHNALSETRELFYKKRKNLFFTFNKYNRLSKPKWMLQYKDTRFKSTYDDQKILFKEGRIVLASLVQANSLLFNEGTDDHPAAMIFSEDLYFENHPEDLIEISSNLFNIKGKEVNDLELQAFSNLLANEIDTLFNYKLPKKLTSGRDVFFTSFIINRKHLPSGYIDFRLFPALILPEKTDASIILPSNYWPYKFHEYLQYIAFYKSSFNFTF